MGINEFLLQNKLFIKENPAISPDMTINFETLLREILEESKILTGIVDRPSAERIAGGLMKLVLWPKSIFYLGKMPYFVIESKQTGDCALITLSEEIPSFDDVALVGERLSAVPLFWSNLKKLKNAVLDFDPISTIFPRVDPRLKRTSLGIGARFTANHWPGVAWAMKALGLPLTANQNSIPRELVYDVDAMLSDQLAKVPFPFIGGSVPEGHQGQSVQGMSHAAIITFLKHGFHLHKIPWGFNADHQPIGGRFDAIEENLVEGSLFASYITYDLSPELSSSAYIDDPERLETVFQSTVGTDIFDGVVDRLSSRNLELPAPFIKKMVTYLMPAMKKMKRRDERAMAIRSENFTNEAGRRFLRELSIDELPGETTPEAFAVCCAMAEALGVKFDFIAPNIGFQKNMPYPDTAALGKKIQALHAIARRFDVSIGFHSGSGKSGENYNALGEKTEGRFEVKTSGRFTYEMGVALSKSTDPGDRTLWTDWYDFTKRLAIESAFSQIDAQKSFARDFISRTFAIEGVSLDGAFLSANSLRKALDGLKPSPEHVFWFEYNFLFVLAAQGDIARLGDHSPEGYRQRSRFYKISDQARLLFAQRIVDYIVFLAESTGMVTSAAAKKAREKSTAFTEYKDFLEDIGGPDDMFKKALHK